MSNLTPLEERMERETQERLAFFALSETEQKKQQVQNFIKYSKDPWAFLSDCVWTRDAVDAVQPIKPFPSHKQYIKFLAFMWMKHKLLALPKSRRLTASWTCCALYTWEAIFVPHRHTGFVSKKEEDSYELVLRAEFIYKNIPEWRIPSALLPKIKGGGATRKPPILAFEEPSFSKIQGFPQGEDQLRQFTLSGILEDECAFWEEAEGSYAGAKPTTDGGGRLTMISSRSPGFFKKIVFDKLNSPDLNFAEIPPAEVKFPMKGVETWQNPKNGFQVIDLHYTADPEKQSTEWREAIMNGMPRRKFLMEYEKNWETFEGKPVYEDFQKGIHSVASVLKPISGLPLIIGVDFGLTPSMILGQLDGPQLRILSEHTALGSIDKLAKAVWSHLSMHYENWVKFPDMIFTVIDPAGTQRAQTDERTCMSMLTAAGFKKISLGPIDWETRRSSVEHFLTTFSKQGAGLLVSEVGCPTLVQGFTGGYKFSEQVYEIEPMKARPLKNNFSHPHDALQYLAHFAHGKQKQHNRYHNNDNLKGPHYGFQKG
jgi:hypothetical protein